MKVFAIAAMALILASCTSTSPEIEGVRKAEEYSGNQYVRKDYRHWIDEDKDCQDTRQEVLIAESTIPVTFKTDKNCKIASGRWEDPYSGEVFTDPSKLDVDHMVPLAEAHRSGAWEWDVDEKKAYANDLSYPEHLIAVSARENRRKGDRDPKNYLPPKLDYRCSYLRAWVEVKAKWRLSVDYGEMAAITEFSFEACE